MTETGTNIQSELTEKYEAFYYIFGILKYCSLSTVNICITLQAFIAAFKIQASLPLQVLMWLALPNGLSIA